MRPLHPHQLRPRVYFTLGFGWYTDRWYDQKNKIPNEITGKN